MSAKVRKAMTALTREDRSAGLEAAATEVEVIKMGKPKASHTEIADRMGIEGDLREETVEAIIRSREMKAIKEKIESRALKETDNFMDLLVGMANDIRDERVLDAMQMVINLWDKRQQEKTINIMIDNRSVSVPFVKAEWGHREGQPYHIPTYNMAMQSGGMADICRSEGCVHSKQGADIGEALFNYREDNGDEPEPDAQ